MIIKNVTIDPKTTLIVEESEMKETKVGDTIKTIIVVNKDSVLENIVIK